MTEDDMRIAQTLERTNWSGNPYMFNMDRALPALAGHPLVFTGEDDLVPVEVVKAEPELRVKKVKSEYQISFNCKNSENRSSI